MEWSKYTKLFYSSKAKILLANQDMDLFEPFGIIKSEASNTLKGAK